VDKVNPIRLGQGRLNTLRVLFVLAHVLFLWMYFSADALERMAHQHLIAGPAGMDILRITENYASAWRHGMAGNSFLYLPGFFAAAALTWVWSVHRPLPKLAVEWAALLAVSLVVAALLAPFGTSRCIRSFEQATGLYSLGARPGFTAGGMIVALHTIFTWDVEMICCRLSIARRSLRLMWIPIVLNVVLARVRPWTVSDFTGQWIGDIAQAKGVAIFSAMAVLVLAAFMVFYQLKSEGYWKSAGGNFAVPGSAQPKVTCSGPPKGGMGLTTTERQR
jgi:hypothetical protein